MLNHRNAGHTRIHKPWILFVVAFLFCPLGCKPASQDSAIRVTSDETEKSLTEEPNFEQSVETTHEELRGWMRKEHAALFLVDYWATWCGPCVDKFPKVVELESRFRNRGLVVTYVSFDDPDESEEISNFVRSSGAMGRSWVRRQKVIDAFQDFQIESLPTYRLYDSNGTPLESFDGESAFEDLSHSVSRRLENR